MFRNIKNYVKRAINRFYTLMHKKLKEKTFGNDSNRIKYLFFPEGNNDLPILTVCFPAFAGKGAKYNYVKTLSQFKVNKLFLLDDIGGISDKGNYLLKKEIKKNVLTLIQSLLDKYNPQIIIFLGSSKGGYSALEYSFEFKNTFVCIAAPQYFVADYLINTGKEDNLKTILNDNINEERIHALNNHLKSKILNSNIHPNAIYIHYSDQEHTYNEHIVDLLKDIRKAHIELHEDIEHYPNHMDLVNYFPDFLKMTISKIINNI